MTGPGARHEEGSQDQTPPFPRPPEPAPWQQFPQAPVNYPDYPPQPPPYGYPPPPYPGPYDPYLGYPVGPPQTSGLAVASLVTSIAGVVLGVPLAMFCYVGMLIPIVGAALGAAALSQIKQTHQPGRGLAIAGLAIGATTTAILVILIVGLVFAVHSLTMLR